MTDATQTTEQAAEAAKPKLTRREKLTQQYTKAYVSYEKLVTELQEIKAELDAIAALENIGPNSAVVIVVGKGDTAKDVDGVVVAVKEDEDGARTYKVQYGTGFDTDIAVVKAGRIKLPSAAPAQAEQPAQTGDAFFAG